MKPPIRNKIQTAAKARGVSIKELLVTTVAKEGTIFNAAHALGVHPNAVHYQMKRHGLISVRSQGRTELMELQAS